MKEFGRSNPFNLKQNSNMQNFFLINSREGKEQRLLHTTHSPRIIEYNCANITVEDCFSQFISRWRLLSDPSLIRRNSAVKGRGGGSRSRRPPKAKRCETCMVARPPKLRARNLVHHPPSMKFPLKDHVS
ncbi:hypothetical protein CEXT_400541 [Caerostris extrusa]|uniref:Uncharacterized protein n=1 Tax=Caerostris extrusa TaxID=172846 RepID=A0AAV4REI7_CAEEX|nr:hypothetical protein CEXT_400541 [Caerostris extrusa]